MKSKIRVGVVEDEMIIAETICLSLKRLGYDFCTPANSFEEAVEMIEKDRPDILLLDINLNAKLDGIELAHFINAHFKIPIIYLTGNSQKSTIERSKSTLPYGFLVKPFRESDLQASIEISLFNHKNNQSEKEVKKYKISPAMTKHYGLTSREEQIVILISEGLRHKEVGTRLLISESTVKKHLSNVYLKTEVQSIIEALNKLS